MNRLWKLKESQTKMNHILNLLNYDTAFIAHILIVYLFSFSDRRFNERATSSEQYLSIRWMDKPNIGPEFREWANIFIHYLQNITIFCWNQLLKGMFMKFFVCIQLKLLQRAIIWNILNLKTDEMCLVLIKLFLFKVMIILVSSNGQKNLNRPRVYTNELHAPQNSNTFKVSLESSCPSGDLYLILIEFVYF